MAVSISGMRCLGRATTMRWWCRILERQTATVCYSYRGGRVCRGVEAVRSRAPTRVRRTHRPPLAGGARVIGLLHNPRRRIAVPRTPRTFERRAASVPLRLAPPGVLPAHHAVAPGFPRGEARARGRGLPREAQGDRVHRPPRPGGFPSLYHPAREPQRLPRRGLRRGARRRSAGGAAGRPLPELRLEETVRTTAHDPRLLPGAGRGAGPRGPDLRHSALSGLARRGAHGQKRAVDLAGPPIGLSGARDTGGDTPQERSGQLVSILTS